MPLFETYRQTRAKLSAPESVDTLSQMQSYFLDGENWAQGVYRGKGDTRCMAGAAEYLRESSIDDAKFWLREAIAERTGGAIATIEEFNDGQQSFDEVAAVIDRAKQLAAANLPARLPAPEVTPARLASPSWGEPQPQSPPVREQDRRSLWSKMEDWLD